MCYWWNYVADASDHILPDRHDNDTAAPRSTCTDFFRQLRIGRRHLTVSLRTCDIIHILHLLKRVSCPGDEKAKAGPRWTKFFLLWHVLNMYLLPDFILQMENFIVCVIVYLWSLVQIGGVYVAGRPSRITRLNKNLTADLLLSSPSPLIGVLATSSRHPEQWHPGCAP